MKRLTLPAVLLLVACSVEAPAPETSHAEPALAPATLPIDDAAGHRMEALTQEGDRWCTENHTWCVQSGEQTAGLVRQGDASLPLPAPGAPWPNVILTGPESALIGLITSESQMYSGGDASTTHLTLYDVSGGAVRAVGTMPLTGAAAIRACFNEDDQQRRAGACQDRYTFVSRVSIDAENTGGPPRIVLETAAGTFPGQVSRQEDSSERAPLTEQDLVWWQDDACSFRRVYTLGADGTYAPDQPLPACGDYLEP
mgnify:CR=1 FL=1